MLEGSRIAQKYYNTRAVCALLPAGPITVLRPVRVTRMVASEHTIFIVCSEQPTGGNEVKAGGGGADGGKPPSGGSSNLGRSSDTSEPSGEGRRIFAFVSRLYYCPNFIQTMQLHLRGWMSMSFCSSQPSLRVLRAGTRLTVHRPLRVEWQSGWDK